jgi:hypothetical protein
MRGARGAPGGHGHSSQLKSSYVCAQRAWRKGGCVRAVPTCHWLVSSQVESSQATSNQVTCHWLVSGAMPTAPKAAPLASMLCGRTG